MADTGLSAKQSADPLLQSDAGLRQAMELLFFAYRDFTGEADALLATFGFGRAHHRVIYFVGSHPGMTVSELLKILKITKQSLSRVLGQLIKDGLVHQRTDDTDRRLYLTPKGAGLKCRLTERQSQRIPRAYREAGVGAIEGFRAVLRGIINEEDRHRVARADPPAAE